MALIDIASLVVDLQMNTASFVSGMDKAGQIALTSTRNIQRAFDAMAAGVITALGSVETAIAVMVDKALTNAARLSDLSQATGVSTAALSALEYAAKQSGVSAEGLDKALEKMSKAMALSAQGTGKNAAVFRQFGISITDATGKLRPAQDVLTQLATKFSTMADGPAKTAAAMAIFGKAGAELVPLLNRGAGGIDALMEEAKQLGVVIGDDEATAAKKFEESMNKLKATAEGAANTLASKLLPSLQLVVDNVTEGAKQNDSTFKALLDFGGIVGKSFIVAFSGVQTFFDSLRELVQRFESDVVIAFGGIGAAGKAALKGNIKEAYSDIRDTNSLIAANDQDSRNKQKQIWQEYFKGVESFWNASQQKMADDQKPKRTGAAPAPINTAADAFTKQITERIAKLQDQAAAEGKLANAIKSEADATVVATAAVEAQKTIDDLNAQGKKDNVKVTLQQADAIKSATLLLASYKSALDSNKELQSQIEKTQVATKGVKELAAAYMQGAAAIEAADEKQKLAPFSKQVTDLTNLIDLLKKLGVTDKDLAPLNSALSVLQSKFTDLSVAVNAEARAQEELNLSKSTNDFNIQKNALQDYSIAVLHGAEALRQFNIEQQVQAFSRANPLLDATQLDSYRAGLEKVSDSEQLKRATEKVNSFAHQSEVQEEIDLLTKYRTQLIANGASEQDIDLQLHNLQVQRQQDWDRVLLGTNSATAGIKVFFDQYLNDGKTAAQTVDQLLTQTWSGMEDNLARALNGAKTDWANFFKSLELELTKLALNQAFKSLFSGLNLGALFSGGGAAAASGGAGINFAGFLAGGGDADPGNVYAVGERGMELFAPHTPGTVIPHNAISGLGSKPLYVTNHFNFPNGDADSFIKSEGQIASSVQRSIQIAHARNN